MAEIGEPLAVVMRLERAKDQLIASSQRVAEAAQAAPRHDASGWQGFAAQAYQHSLDQLSRELEGAQQLLRSATGLTAAALFEVAGHA